MVLMVKPQVCMYVTILFLHLLKSIHNMFYKTTYNGITLQEINIIYKELLYVTCRKNIKVWFVQVTDGSST